MKEWDEANGNKKTWWKDISRPGTASGSELEDAPRKTRHFCCSHYLYTSSFISAEDNKQKMQQKCISSPKIHHWPGHKKTLGVNWVGAPVYDCDVLDCYTTAGASFSSPRNNGDLKGEEKGYSYVRLDIHSVYLPIASVWFLKQVELPLYMVMNQAAGLLPHHGDDEITLAFSLKNNGL